MSAFAFIIAAGKQKRFKDALPKALVKINDTCLLDMNIAHFKKYCKEVYVVCSVENAHFFKDYKTIIIHSGFGSGDAAMKALNKFNFNDEDTCFIAWGDALQDEKLYDEVIKNYIDKIIIPCNLEDSPYVQIKEDGEGVKVYFSKFHEPITKGYHDLSLFYGNANVIKDALNKLHTLIWKNDHYEHKHGNEMEFLDIFNEVHVPASILDMHGIKSYSFNTLEELENIEHLFQK